MATNFDFLRDTDVNLYDIISDAEKLYRDEYFEQCIGQTRRFAENVCKKVLGKNRTSEETFDQMLATLKDNSQGFEQEREFIDDLYFLKKCGNQSVHSGSVKKNGINALECLKRAFEVAINYAVYNQNGDKEFLNLHYDVKLLATGKKTKNLAEKYQKAEEKSKTKNSKKSTKISQTPTSKNTKTKNKKQHTSIKSVPKKKKFSGYWTVVTLFSIVTFCLIIYILFFL